MSRPRTFTDSGRDLTAIRRQARREKRQLGGITPRTAARARELLAEADALCAIDDAARKRAK